MRPCRPLTDTYLRKLAPPPGRLGIRDAVVRGLVLRVGSSGARTWGVWYRVSGRATRFTPRPLSQRRLCQRWAHPRGGTRSRTDIVNAARMARDLQAERVEVRQANTLGDMAADLLTDGRSLRKKTPWRAKTRAEFERLLEVEILPALGAKRSEEVTKADVLALIGRIAKRAPTTANRTLSVIKLLYA